MKEFGLQTDKYPKVPDEIKAFIALLLFTLSISSIFSDSLITSTIATFRMLIFLIISFLFYSLLIDEENIKTYIYSIFIVVLIIAAPMIIDLYNLGIQNYFIRVLLVEKFDVVKTTGYTGMTILFISISLITAMFFMRDFKKITYKTPLIFLCLINILALILANSRGGILAAIVSVSFILLKLKPVLFRKTLLPFSVLIVGLIIMVPKLNEAFDFYMRWETVSDREVYWQMGLDIIRDNPIVGTGPDLFDKYFFNYAPSKIINQFKPDFSTLGTPHPHNFFLYYTAENGILGLITSVAFFIVFFYLGYRTMKLTKDVNRDHYIISIAIFGIGLGLFFRSFIEVTGYLVYGYITVDLPFWIIFGTLISIHNKYTIFEFPRLKG